MGKEADFMGSVWTDVLIIDNPATKNLRSR